MVFCHRLAHRLHRAEDRAARRVEVSRDQVDRVDQVGGERAVPADAGTESAVDGGARRAHQVASERHDVARRCRCASAVASGVNGSHSDRSQSSPSACPLTRATSTRPSANITCSSDSSRKASESGNDAEPFERAGRLRAARIDDHDAPAALDDVVHAVLDPRCGQETAVGDNRIGAHHHQQIGARQIGYRHRRRHAVEQLARDQPAVGVLRRGGEVVAVTADALDEHRAPRRCARS